MGLVDKHPRALETGGRLWQGGVMAIAIVTDSVACIPEGMRTELGIISVPYYIHRGEETLRDSDFDSTTAFYSWLPTTDQLPTTACPGPGDYLQIYRGIVRKGGRQILSVHMTSKGSGAYHSASSAKRMLSEEMRDVTVQVVDTLNVAMCHGWMVIEAARAAQQGKGLDAIMEIIRAMMPVTRMIQTADTLRYLFMGGRIGRAQHLVGSLLNIKPLISMQDGVIVSLGQARSRKRAYEKMVDLVEGAVGPGGEIKVAYIHAAAREEAEKIRAKVAPRLTCVETLFSELPPSLGVHTGPGTAGVCYYPARALGR